MFIKYVLYFFVSLGLVACGSEKNNNVQSEDIDALIQAVENIPPQSDATGDTDSLEGRSTRTLKLDIDSNIKVGTIYLSETNQSYPFFNKSFKEIDLPFSGTVTIPDVAVSVRMRMPSDRYTVSPYEVMLTEGETAISQYFTVTDTLTALTTEFNAKGQAEKESIVELLTSLSVGIETLDMAKVEQVKILIDDLFLQYPEKRDTLFYKRLIDLKESSAPFEVLKTAAGL